MREEVCEDTVLSGRKVWRDHGFVWKKRGVHDNIKEAVFYSTRRAA